MKVTGTPDILTANARRPRLAVEICLVLAISLLGAYTTSRPALGVRSVYQDNMYEYGFFYDNTHSLNLFGQKAYWLPHKDDGYPWYFISSVGQNYDAPCAAALATVVWALGRLGFHFEDCFYAYMAYIGFLAPVLLCLSVFALAKQLFRSPTVVGYVVIVTAWSPGVALNLGLDGYVEPLAYGLFLFATWLSFCKQPSMPRFYLLTLCLLVCSVSLSAGFFIVLPLLAISFVCTIVPLRAWRRTGRAVRSVPIGAWVVAAMLVVACAIPKFVMYYHVRGEFLRLGLSSDRYDLEQLKPGNPLVVLAAGTPDVGFDWNEYWPSARRENEFLPVSIKMSGYTTYVYLGILALPLSLFGFLYGRPSLRNRLSVVLVVMFSSMVLASHSPLFSLVLALPTPFRSFNHFSDLLFQGGGFVVLLFCAAVGLEALLRPRLAGRNRILWLYACCAAGSIAFYLTIHWRHSTCLGSMLGFLLFMTVAFAVTLTLLAASRSVKEIQGLSIVLLFLVATDVSTVVDSYQRHVCRATTHKWVREISGRTAQGGLGAADDVYGWPQFPLVLARLHGLKQRGVAIQALPSFGLYGRAHIVEEVTQEDICRAIATGKARSLALAPARLEDSFGLDKFIEGARAGVADAPGTFRANWSNYNTVHVEVDAGQECLLFIRNAYFPGWTASVNGDGTRIFRALGAFQAVPVPAGQSKVVLRFWPKYEAMTLWLAYGILAAWVVLTLIAFFRGGQSSASRAI